MEISGKELIQFLLAVLLLILAIGIGIFSFRFACSQHRGRKIPIVISAIACALGSVLAILVGFPDDYSSLVLLIYLVCWSPLVVGCISLWRWRTTQSGLTRWGFAAIPLMFISILLMFVSYMNARAASCSLIESVGLHGKTPSRHYFAFSHDGKLSPRWVFFYTGSTLTRSQLAEIHVSVMGVIKYRKGEHVSGSNIHGIDS